ncbi:DUF4300 family protein [Actinomyces radicidentis]|uniref:DUF4300 family protein n=1 Tax=Actinomyces radicidentis TaxID=111015 RepID=UPI0026DEB890|nr:DUF4300 family protein [Actinomyces radicidentis]
MDISRRALLSLTAVAGGAAALGTSAAQARADLAAARTSTKGSSLPQAAHRTVPTDGLTVGTFTNLASAASRDAVCRQLVAAGVPAERVTVTMNHAEQVYAAVGTTGLATGFRSLAKQPARYDAYAMQDDWTAKHPDFPGYNCRLTAYTLASSIIKVAGTASPKAPLYDDLFMDHDAIKVDKAAVPSARDRVRFDSVWTAVLTTRTKKVATQLATLQKAWRSRGVSFTGGPLSLISVVMYTELEKPELFIGHTGVLIERTDGTLLLVEKLAFQEPYQVTVFSRRQQVSDYLMRKYDADPASTDAPAMILENDRLIEGYRRVKT